MSDLAKLSTKKEYEINGVKLTLESVEADENVAKFIEGDKMSPEQSMKMMHTLVERTLRASYPDATEDEMKQSMKMRNLVPLVEAVMDVNGFNKEEKSNVNLIKDRIKAIQDNAAKKSKPKPTGSNKE